MKKKLNQGLSGCPRWIVITMASVLGATAISLGGFVIYQQLNTPIQHDYNKITFDANGGTLEYYDSSTITFPINQNEKTWRQFYPNHNYVGATKKGYDFLCWSIDGINPIPNDYVFDKSVTLKPLYVKNDNCLTIACRFLDDSFSDNDSITPEYYYGTKIKYSINGEEYKPFVLGESITDLTAGDYVSFKKDQEDRAFVKFNISVTKIKDYMFPKTRFAISGMFDEFLNLYNGEAGAFIGNAYCSARGLDLSTYPMTNHCFNSMFGNEENNNLLYAPELPATTLARGCYQYMFYNCQRLIQAPSEISAEEIPELACEFMFRYCTNLTKMPDLTSIKTIKEDGCHEMFYHCIALEDASKFDVEIVGKEACSYMFEDCRALKVAPVKLSATQGIVDGIISDGIPRLCYKGMFENCTSLTVAPEICATKLANESLEEMFTGCTNLKEIKIDHTGPFRELVYKKWVDGVAPTGTFYYNGDDIQYGVSAIPTGWDVKKF